MNVDGLGAIATLRIPIILQEFFDFIVLVKNVLHD